MTIAIISAISKTPVSQTSGSLASGNGEAGSDFLSLLSGQLLDPMADLVTDGLVENTATPNSASTELTSSESEPPTLLSLSTEQATDPALAEWLAALTAAAGGKPATVHDAPAVASTEAADTPLAIGGEARPLRAHAAASDTLNAATNGLQRSLSKTAPADKEAGIATGQTQKMANMANPASTPLSLSSEAAVAPETTVSTAKFAVETTSMLSNATQPSQNSISSVTGALATHSLPPGQAIASSQGSAAPPPAMTARLADPEWPVEFGQRVVWMNGNDRQFAQLTLNPPQLGPIEISLNISNDQATAAFVSPHADVREAIENALPRLREMLAGSGISLGQTSVGAESHAQQAHDNAARQPRHTGQNPVAGSLDSGIAGASTVTQHASGRGLVDIFA